MDIQQLKEIRDNFLNELNEAKAGKKTSLPFIINEIATASLVKDNEIFQVLVIGGSVCKSATVRKKGSDVEILAHGEKDQPAFHTKEDLLSFIDKELDKEVRVVAVNFAYPMTPIFENGRLDGIVISGVKENSFGNLVGQKLGLEIEEYIKRKYHRDIVVSTANDTICLLLSGLTTHPWNEIAAGIVGTGLNFAIFLDEKTAVNLEAANFDKFPLSSQGKEIDSESAIPGGALFEKETSGAYVYRHFNILIKERGISHPPVSSTWELKKLALKNEGEVSEIALSLVKRSAALVAAMISGMTLFYDKDMTFVMEGSFFWGEDIYKNYVTEYVKELVTDHTISFTKVDDSPIVGGAKLVS
jgi:hexokinase